MKRAALAVLLCVAALGAAGCSLLPTGPNRAMRVLGPQATGDFATFEGTVAKRCADVRVAAIDEAASVENVVVGCVMKVAVVGSEAHRTVFCPLGEIRDKCTVVPVNARISINGRPLGDQLAYVPTSIDWRAE